MDGVAPIFWIIYFILAVIVWIYGGIIYLRYKNKKDMESGHILDVKIKKNLK